jgi:hypothetical protein
VTDAVVVELEPHEVYAAIVAGAGRRFRGIALKRSSTLDPPSRTWGADVQAVGAEVALAKHLDRFWIDSPLPDPAGDVGSASPRVHVLHTELETGRLILRAGDDDDGVFVLVVGKLPSFRLAGWITAREGKTDAFRVDDVGNGRPGCWMVPQSALRPVGELRR